MRVLTLPRAPVDWKSYISNSIFLAFSDSLEKAPLEFYLHKKDASIWEELQWDLETGRSAALPRDMIYGFCLFPCPPAIEDGSKAQETYERMLRAMHKSSTVPALKDIPRLKRKDFLTDGMVVILVRLPRPIGGRIVIPATRRREILRLEAEVEMGNVSARKTLAELREKTEQEVHPTEAQLYQTLSGVLVQAVPPYITCSRCGMRGHHSMSTHEDVVEARPNGFLTEWPVWMNILPMPQEQFNLPETQQGGFVVEVRRTTARVPLRLARQMRLHGHKIEGEIHASGVH